MKKMVAILICAAVSLNALSLLWAQSLWTEDNGTLFTDGKAHKEGDLITIIISESSQAQQNSSTTTSKATTSELAGNAGTGALSFLPDYGMGLENTNEFEGDGQTVRAGSFQSRITARIIDVLPNGNLLIEGTRTMSINSERENITVRGMVRPQDINADNTVQSQYIAEAEIIYDGRGVVTEVNRPGLLTRIFNWVF